MKNKILFVVCLLMGLLFINAGLNILLQYMPMPKDVPQGLKDLMGAFNSIGWLMPLVAAAQIAGGVTIIFKKTRALGAIILFPVIIGILLTHFIQVPSGLPMAIVIFAIELWVMHENRDKYFQLIEYRCKNL